MASLANMVAAARQAILAALAGVLNPDSPVPRPGS